MGPYGIIIVMKILIVDDDRNLAEMVAKALGECGFSCLIAADGDEALLWLKGNAFDAVVTDVMMPKTDGFTLVRRLRAEGLTLPVIVLSAKGDVTDRIRGLEYGADDYLAKPFSISELIARLQAVLRRASGRSEPTSLTAGELKLDLLSRKLTANGRPVELQPLELKLIEYLMRNQGRVVPRMTILEHVWDYSSDPHTNVVETRVCRIREKLGTSSDGKPFIRTVKGFGYAID